LRIYLKSRGNFSESPKKFLLYRVLFGYQSVRWKFFQESIAEDVMGDSNAVTPSTNLQKAVVWIAEVVLDKPDKDRQSVIKDAQIRFDLTPAECTFLTEKFTGKS
jgi:hypothetical protein